MSQPIITDRDTVKRECAVECKALEAEDHSDQYVFQPIETQKINL